MLTEDHVRLLVIGMILFSAALAAAQEFPKAEIFGGYSYANMPLLTNRTSTNGWNASATINFYRWFGLTSDFGGLYGADGGETLTLGTATVTEKVTENIHTFMFGPQVSYRRSRFVAFAHFLVGENRTGETISLASTSPVFVTTSSGPRSATGSCAGMGLGVDFAINKKLAWRLQGDSLITNNSSSNARISTGLVFRIGH